MFLTSTIKLSNKTSTAFRPPSGITPYTTFDYSSHCRRDCNCQLPLIEIASAAAHYGFDIGTKEMTLLSEATSSCIRSISAKSFSNVSNHG
jgi:hypothetical protein